MFSTWRDEAITAFILNAVNADPVPTQKEPHKTVMGEPAMLNPNSYASVKSLLLELEDRLGCTENGSLLGAMASHTF